MDCKACAGRKKYITGTRLGCGKIEVDGIDRK
jgi:hypothetical protein